MKELIDKILKQIKENKWIHYIIIIVIGIILSISLVKIQIRDTHDGSLHMLRLIGTYDTLKIGQFPPLINQNYCKGVGYSMNLFYPPLVTYLPLLIKIFSPTYMIALKFFGALCIILSGITMYKFVYQVTNKKVIALFAAIFYMVAPYKLANVYKRFAIGEFTAMIFIPLVFLGLYNLVEQDKKKHYYIAIGAIGLMLSHSVTTLYTAIFSIIYLLFNFSKVKNVEVIKKCIINVIFILLVSMLFWLPLLEVTSHAEYSIMNDEIMRTDNEWAAANTISFKQLFIDIGEENGTTFVLGIPTIITILLTIYTIRKVENKYKEYYILTIILALIALFMASRFFPWIIMPNILCKMQYPWRMLGFFVFFSSFICGVNLEIIVKSITKKRNLKIILVIVFLITLIITSLYQMTQFFTDDIKKDEKYENKILENKKISHLQINRDYMPVKALLLQRDYVLNRKDKTYILEGNANIVKEQKENLLDKIVIENIEKDTVLEFPYYYYVGYKITIKEDENIKTIKPVESKNGYLSCKIEDNIDKAEIEVEYVGTFITYLSYIISMVSLILFVIYIIKERKKIES